MYCESVVRMLFSVQRNDVFLFDFQRDTNYFVNQMLHLHHLHHFDWRNGFDD